MSSLKQLTIKGVRSFSPDTEQTLTFMSPVTLILGQNGTGKTVMLGNTKTVIECLKVLSAGTMPPSSENGRRFVHDPKVKGVTEIKACLKLSFMSKENKEVRVKWEG
eukprot:TRINITY_DN2076_c0_g1_i5.p3 TRINITY_DN2076_c0_g1~~TRINITY_DN2076_c0_g1_i5.p3  ORF type:complete len:107 (-),score=26.91 TRINITY_DN2076_c0_g1_i5:203-523(-)